MYFGSVRFFKNLILLSVCLLILIPTLLAVKFYRQAQGLIPLDGMVIVDNDAAHGSPDEVFEPDPTSSPSESGEQISTQDASQSDWQNEIDAPVAAADPPSYELLYDDFYAPQPYNATERIEKTAYLTFDDGPSDRTDEILAVLAEKDVKATFFVTGKSDPADLERMRKIVEAGHTIGMHSFSHDYALVYGSVESFLDEFHQNFVQIREATGVTPTVFRFPGGSINGYDASFYREIISEMIRRGFVPFDWNISSEDAASNRLVPTGELVENVVRNANGKVRAFILFHDSEPKSTSVQAVGPVIDQLRQMGYTLSAITPTTLPVLYHYTE